MKKLSFALGLAGVFGFATAADATPLDQPFCITYLEPQENLTHCEYRKPHMLEIKTSAGTAFLKGSVDMKSEPFNGQNRNQCEAFFKEKEKEFGPCRIRVHWDM